VATPNTTLNQRAEISIEDAFYIRDRFIPAALDGGRWNIARFESFGVVERVVKAMICLLGIRPCHTHDISILWDQIDAELASPERLSWHLPMYIALVTPGHDSYGVEFFDASAYLWKRVHGSWTALGQAAELGDYDLQDLLEVRIGRDNCEVELYIGGDPVSRQTDATLVGPYQSEHTFSLQPSQARAENLKRAGAKLLEGRAPAFYSETVSDEKAARQAVGIMEECLEMLKEMVIRSEVT